MDRGEIVVTIQVVDDMSTTGAPASDERSVRRRQTRLVRR